jgi:translation initiation factor IF-1
MDSDGARSRGAGAQVAAFAPLALRRAKDVEMAELVGVVTETLPSAMYRVRLEQGAMVMAHIADRMDRNFVRLLVGDRVRLELSPVDAGRGRIVVKV